jgi:ribosomal protein L32E
VPIGRTGPAAGQNEELTFARQERERALRVNERRAEEIDSQVRQEVDLQLA